MACNSCAKPFSILRKEKGCPGCGFSYCSKCLNNKIFLPKINAEAKVCSKCKRLTDNSDAQKTVVEPPDAYYRRLGALDHQVRSKNTTTSTPDEQILERLQKLKEARNETKASVTDEDIKYRLQNIKGEIPSTSTDEIQARLAKLRGVPFESLTSKSVFAPPDTRTEEQQANDLLQQYKEQVGIDTKYNEQFDEVINQMETRMKKLKGTDSSDSRPRDPEPSLATPDSEDEAETVRKIVEKIKAEASLEPDELPQDTNDELPFCEICNEDARMRCLGCKYLFCRQCFLEHKDDDDGCNRYEPYEAPRNQH